MLAHTVHQNVYTKIICIKYHLIFGIMQYYNYLFYISFSANKSQIGYLEVIEYWYLHLGQEYNKVSNSIV